MESSPIGYKTDKQDDFYDMPAYRREQGYTKLALWR